MHTPRIEVLISSSRDLPKRSRTFLNDLSYVVPSSLRLNRGRTSLKEIFTKARKLGASKVLILVTKRGNPSILFLFSTSGELLGYLMIAGVKLSTDMRITRKELLELLKDAKSFCIKESECPIVSSFLTDLGYTLGSECDVTAEIRTMDDLCVVRFLHKSSLMLPPEIRLQLNEGNDSIYKWGISLINESVKGRSR